MPVVEDTLCPGLVWLVAGARAYLGFQCVSDPDEQKHHVIQGGTRLVEDRPRDSFSVQHHHSTPLLMTSPSICTHCSPVHRTVTGSSVCLSVPTRTSCPSGIASR